MEIYVISTSELLWILFLWKNAHEQFFRMSMQFQFSYGYLQESSCWITKLMRYFCSNFTILHSVNNK